MMARSMCICDGAQGTCLTEEPRMNSSSQVSRMGLADTTAALP